MDGFVVFGLLAAPLLISLGAFFLEFIATYGLQDIGLAKHRRFFKVVGCFAAGVGAIAAFATTFGIIQLPA